MRPDDALRPLAASLAQQDWDAAALERHLRQRLPPQMAGIAAPVAAGLKVAFPLGVAPDARAILSELRRRPEAEAILRLARRVGRAPDQLLTPNRFTPDPGLPDFALPPLATTAALAEWLAISPDELVRFADRRGLSAHNPSAFAGHYRLHTIPKRDGTMRLIEEPKPFLKRLQRRLLAGLLDRVVPHQASYGFRKGRSCIEAAARHAGEAVVVGFDLADFFASIDFARVYSLFRTLGYPPPVARALSGLSTALVPASALAAVAPAGRGLLRHRHLPQGAPTSPAIANLCAFRLDRRLAGLAGALDARYTRYADDLTFLGDRRIAAVLARAVPAIVSGERFRLNPAKTRVQPAGARQVVAGLTVNARVNVPRAEFDRLKAILHRLGNREDPRRRDPAFLAHLSGRIGWVEQVNPARGRRLRVAFAGL